MRSCFSSCCPDGFYISCVCLKQRYSYVADEPFSVGWFLLMLPARSLLALSYFTYSSIDIVPLGIYLHMIRIRIRLLWSLCRSSFSAIREVKKKEKSNKKGRSRNSYTLYAFQIFRRQTGLLHTLTSICEAHRMQKIFFSLRRNKLTMMLMLRNKHEYSFEHGKIIATNFI
jgi:hypothetical protein